MKSDDEFDWVNADRRDDSEGSMIHCVVKSTFGGFIGKCLSGITDVYDSSSTVLSQYMNRLKKY